ncbi:MAG: Uma2 family endonuclease [Turicibacter sp.]|nr:Uma2 family endonuclease [Turicibacter sp.]
MDLAILEMSAPRERHSELTSTLFGELYILSLGKKFYLRKEDRGLVYQKHCGNGDIYSLVDVTDDEITADVIEELGYIIPDILLFDKNPYLLSKSATKLAGFPDLVIEVWSASDTKYIKAIKHTIYATGNTEHWYLTQKSNKVECWLGREKLKSQNLSNVLKTQAGLAIDLRELALEK